MAGVTSELIDNLVKTTNLSTLQLFRVTYRGQRMYIQTTPFEVYSGLTGALAAATFKGNEDSKRLTRWRDKMINQLGGIENQEAYLNSMADFGTLVHECIVRIWRDGRLNWKAEQEYARLYFMESAKANGITPNESTVDAQVFEYCKNAASLMQFIYDQVDELFGVECMCKDDDLMIATPIDLVCKLKDGRVATLNIKTSSQIGDHQREQVAVEHLMWNKSYPGLQADVTGVLRPKDWMLKKGIPTYELELLTADDYETFLTDAVNRLKICLRSPKSTYLNFPREIPMFYGATKLGEKPLIKTFTLEEIINGGDIQNA